MVAHGWTEQKTQRRKIRFFFLGLPVVLAISFATPLVYFDMYNFTGAYSCFIEEYPLNCDIDPEIWGVCTRGHNARYLQGGLFLFIAVCTVITLVFMSLLVRSVRIQERTSDRYVTIILRLGMYHYLIGFQWASANIIISIPFCIGI